VLKDQQDHKVRLDHKDLEDPKVLKGHKDFKDLLDQQEVEDHKVM
jgi:hypothetical protein